MSHHKANKIKRKLAPFMSLLLAVACMGLLASCGGGAATTETNEPSISVPSTAAEALLNVTGGTKGQKVTVNYDASLSPSDAAKLQWQLSFEGMQQSLIVSSDKLKVEFTPNESGKYIVSVLIDGVKKREASIFVNATVPYDAAKLRNIGSADEIINQSVFQARLSRNQIVALLGNYKTITLLDIGSNGRFMVSYDESSNQAIDELEALKLEKNIIYIGQRIVNQKLSVDYIPNDGSSFNDLGDNWHLEDIGMPEAWDMSRGNNRVMVGVVDGGIFDAHEDLKGRISTKENIPGYGGNSDKTHGTGAASTIAGNTDNKKGISGINHVSNISFSSYKTSAYNSESFEKGCESDSKVRVASHSWGIDGSNRSTLSKEDFNSLHIKAVDKLWDSARISIEQYNQTCLVIKSAGNNYSDAKINGGALQYISSKNDQPTLSLLSNLLIVGAYIKPSANSNRVLAVYSNYGESVEIAAPTEFKAANDEDLIFDDYYTSGILGVGEKYGQSFSGGFNGTSAATPVVAGVASLIFSLDPDFFTPALVKKILIDSAIESGKKITHREVSAGGQLELLPKSIPVLDAAAALKMAKKMLDESQIQAIAKIEEPTSGRLALSLKVPISGGTLQSAFGTISASSNGCAFTTNTNTTFNQSFTVDASGMSKIPLASSGVQCYKIAGSANVKLPSGVISNKNFELYKQIVSVSVYAKDQTSFAPIPQALITLDSFSDTSNTATDGSVTVWLEPGFYKIFASKSGYKGFAQSIFIACGAIDPQLGSQGIKAFLTLDTVKSAGAIAGVVSDSFGKPLSNATVRISGGTQTNGYFASSSTDSNGRYIISNISKFDSTGSSIPSFTMLAFSSGYISESRAQVVVLDGKTRNESFALNIDANPVPVVYSHGFEAGTDWIFNGLWNRTTHSTLSIKNTLVDAGFTSLPPDEASSFAYLPIARVGSSALWYGSSNTGSFIGTQLSSDSTKSGGTSIASNAGDATSPVISLATTTKPKLKFWTWWEIEGINPNENGYDIMDVQISNNGGISYTSIKKLNPKVDPNDASREHKNYSSGGFNRMPVWALEEVDLTPYAGQSIKIRFSFNTKDTKYNGFRGWLIDDLKIEQ